MIKVRVGQVWRNIDTGRDLTIDSDSIEYCDDINTNSYFTFQPQNDLEWLAVNEPDWFHSDCRYIRRDNHRAMYCDDLSYYYNKGFKFYTKAEWQNMRYELGLDKKPHYRLTGGEWVRQCKT